MICLGFLLFSCGDGNSSGNAKENKNLKEVVIERHSEGDKKIVGFTAGNFDIIHPGYVYTFQTAKKLISKRYFFSKLL